MRVSRSTLILCAAAVLAVVVAVTVDRFVGDAEAATEAQLLVAADAFPADVTRIELTRGSDPTLVFERRDDGAWWQTAPIDHRVDPFSMKSLVDAGRDLTCVPLANDGERGLDALGLAPPRGVVVFGDGTASCTIELGRLGFAGRAYARAGREADVVVVPHDLHDRALGMDPKEWRDRRLFHDVSVDADEVVLAVGDRRIRLVREGRQWRTAEPVSARTNGTALDALFQALGRARSAGFVLDLPSTDAATLAGFGLTESAASVTITTTRATAAASGAVDRAPETERLLVGSRMGAGTQDRFGLVVGQPAIVRVPEPVLKAFFPAIETLVATPPSGVAPADVKAVRVRTDGFDVTVERDLERWVLPDDGGREIDAAKVDELLTALTTLQAPEIRLGRYPRESEVGFVTFIGFGGAPIDTVRIARAEDGVGWVMENGDGVLRVFPETLALPLDLR